MQATTFILTFIIKVCSPKGALSRDGNRLTNIRTGHCDLLVFVDDLRQQESCIL